MSVVLFVFIIATPYRLVIWHRQCSLSDKAVVQVQHHKTDYPEKLKLWSSPHPVHSQQEIKPLALK